MERIVRRQTTRREGRDKGLATQIPASAPMQPPPAAEERARERTRRARLRVHTKFHSRFLPDDRDVTVYLPPGYEEETNRRYPVLVMHDGQNLFDPRTSFVQGRTWRMAETADAAIAAGEIEPLVIVGVANTGERRMAEYTPTRDWKMGGGEAAQYGELLTEELLPFLRTNYRLMYGPEHTGLGGSSLGGLATLYLGLKYPELFGRLAVHSPSVWWHHKSIVGLVNEMAPLVPLRARIWLDAGDAEAKKMIADTDLLYRRLLAHGWRDGADLHYERVAGGTHDEAAWALRVMPMLRFLFPA
ncbi:alpha/beta hydrolase [Paracidobacterium acidisoli]|uniref:Esterase family protein n=1 Tax=Paracidobacterium acidisoli TaxID=2303751 RepID=A0A372IL12_9BACT|nr:alpha/beta hydrolase-fold protein [Paracidobacterium acidisoli]MBT9332945.1 esterase [Paracidobacterium acidisoli]